MQPFFIVAQLLQILIYSEIERKYDLKLCSKVKHIVISRKPTYDH